VRRLVVRYGNTPELRRELPGEIYYRFCGLLNAFDPERGIPLRPYLVRQLTAATYAYARKHWRIASREVNLEETDTGFGSEQDPTAKWLHAISQQQIAARLPEAMQRLPRRQRQVVIWRYYEERGFEEIAGILGVKSATVRSLLRHGLANLRRQIVVRDCETLGP
jgi:RNA polymerase sigma factor (sigma-70 family)